MRTWEIRTWRLVLILISLVAPLSSVSAQVSQGRVQSMKLLMANVGWATTDYVVMGRGAAGRLFLDHNRRSPVEGHHAVNAISRSDHRCFLS